MHRTAFLKLAAATTVTAGARLAFPWVAAAARPEVSYAGVLYRAGGTGTIEMSKDAGHTWKLHSSLGEMLSIKSLTVRGGRLHMGVGYAGHSFPLVLAKDKRSWLTA